METLHELLRYTHIGGGFFGLALFWVPIFSKKGGKIHRKIGKIWTWLARVILVAGFSGLLLYLPGFIEKGASAKNYSFLLFLGYLSVVTFIVVNYAVAVLNSKKDPSMMNTLYWQLSAILSIVSSIVVIAFALMVNPANKYVLLALSPVGIGTGIGMLKYMKGKTTSPKQWLYEHLGSMLGAGIAFHTAFAVFGMTRLFDIGLTGGIAVIPWILPAAIGLPATFIWTRHYKKKFKEIPVKS